MPPSQPLDRDVRAPEPKPPTQVAQQLARMDELLAAGQKEIRLLSDELAIILRMPDPVPEEPKTASDAGIVSLAAYLQEFNERLEALDDGLKGLRQRLEL